LLFQFNFRRVFITLSTSVVEISLVYAIELWEQRNQDVHDCTNTKQNQKLLDRHRATIQKLHEHETDILPSDDYLFAHTDDLLTNTNPRVLGNWISTRKAVIKNAKLAATTNTLSILNWFRLSETNLPASPDRRCWHHNNVLHDPYSKKKRRRRKPRGYEHQPNISQYLSLRNII
jgi:hypothetical protein